MDLSTSTDDGAVVRRRITRSMTLSERSGTFAIRSTAQATEQTSKIAGKGAPGVQRAVRTTKSIRATAKPTPSVRPLPPLSASIFGLIQERIADNLYYLVVQAILWNQTTGRQARPVFELLTAQYPTPADLARASLPTLTAMLQPIGLHNIRAVRCIKLGQSWCEQPPCAEKRYVRKGYPNQDGDQDFGEPGWEIAHLPGVGPYALDSYRIFHRDKLRGLAQDWLGTETGDGFEPEWKRVIPTDKELKAYLKWMWLKEGWEWDERSGRKRRLGGRQKKGVE